MLGELMAETGFYQSMTLKSGEPLYSARSEYQKIEIVEAVHYGKVLVLDGVVQLTERDAASEWKGRILPALLPPPSPEVVAVRIVLLDEPVGRVGTLEDGVHPLLLPPPQSLLEAPEASGPVPPLGAHEALLQGSSPGLGVGGRLGRNGSVRGRGRTAAGPMFRDRHGEGG